MSPILVIHIGAGIVGIVSGGGAIVARKGGGAHRALGATFAVAMLILASLGVWLAALLPQMASVAVGVFTAYLAATGWATMKRRHDDAGMAEIGAFLLAAGAGGALLLMGLDAATSPTGLLQGSPPAPYWTFGAFALFAAALDLKVILGGELGAKQRLTRHLWRMCLALFFASAFFFLGQQRALPAFMRGSPLLYIPAVAPLVVMAIWLVRMRLDARPVSARTRSFRALGRSGPVGVA
jgi:hypothetical protein